MEDRVFSTSQIAEIIGKSVHKTISYINRRYLKPSILDASGHGSKRQWSYLDVVRMCLIERLENLGLSVAQIREIAKGATDERLALNRRLILHGGGEDDPGEWSYHKIVLDDMNEMGEPFIPDDVPSKEIRFDLSPAKIVVSMYHLQQWAQERIEKVAQE